MRRAFQGLLVVCPMVSWSNLLHASGNEPVDSADTAVGEVVITAQRRSERLQDVPVSVTAVSGDQLTQQRIENPSDLVGVIPNLQVATTVGEGIPIFSLRGVSMADFSFNQQSPVATYVDEVYKGSFPFLGLELYDLERVEVLRGPQGTLYGKNTTGGAVNVISHKPGFDTEGYFSVGFGNYARVEASGAFQTALSDRIATRVAFTYAKADGWMQSLYPGQPDPNGTRQYAVRVSSLYRASDTLDFTLRLSTSHQDPTNYGIYARPTAPGVGGGIYPLYGGQDYFRTGLGRYDIDSNYVQCRLDETDGVSLTTNWKLLERLTLISITSFDYGKLYIPEDADGSPLKAVEDQGSGSGHTFAEDIRVAGDADGGLTYILGAYYNQETLASGTAFDYFTDIPTDCTLTELVNCIYRNHYKQVKKSTATYADFTYPVVSRVKVRAGLRYTHDTGSISNFSAQQLQGDGTPIANTIPGDPANFNATTGASFANNNVSGKVGVDYTPADHVLVYLTVGNGYRGSAFNAQAYFQPGELNVAAPEKVKSYEVGFKSELLNRSTTLDGAVFYYDYTNQQALSVDPVTLAQTLINIPKSRISGAELEMVSRPVRSLRLNLGVGALNTKIQKGAISGTSIVDHRLPNAPNLSVTAGIDWDIVDRDIGKVTAGLNISATSKQYFELINEDRIAQGEYALLNGRLAYRTRNDHFGVALWGRNLRNKYYYRSAIDISGVGFDYFHLGEPRTYGVSFDARL